MDNKQSFDASPRQAIHQRMEADPLTASMHGMKASIIIPAYNEEVLIGKTLESLQAQTYIDFEIIVIDNASTDQTAAIAESFGVKVIKENRKGTMWACEAGRKVATGEIVIRVDADCIPKNDWLARGLRYFADPAVVGVSGPYDYYDTSRFNRFAAKLGQLYIYQPINWLFQLIGNGAVMIGGNSFIRASALRQIGGFNTTLTFFGDDTDTAKRLAKVGRVLFKSDVIMPTSGRRLNKHGSFTMLIRYWYHFFKVSFTASKLQSK